MRRIKRGRFYDEGASIDGRAQRVQSALEFLHTGRRKNADPGKDEDPSLERCAVPSPLRARHVFSAGQIEVFPGFGSLSSLKKPAGWTGCDVGRGAVFPALGAFCTRRPAKRGSAQELRRSSFPQQRAPGSDENSEDRAANRPNFCTKEVGVFFLDCTATNAKICTMRVFLSEGVVLRATDGMFFYEDGALDMHDG